MPPRQPRHGRMHIANAEPCCYRLRGMAVISSRPMRPQLPPVATTDPKNGLARLLVSRAKPSAGETVPSGGNAADLSEGRSPQRKPGSAQRCLHRVQSVANSPKARHKSLPPLSARLPAASAPGRRKPLPSPRDKRTPIRLPPLLSENQFGQETVLAPVSTYMNFRSRLDELGKRKEAVEKLQAQLEARRRDRLAGLPAEFGFADLASFIRAVESSAAGQRLKRPRKSRVGTKRSLQPRAPVAAVEATGTLAGAVRATALIAPTSDAPPLPAAIGTSLDDPANFTLLPDRSVLAQGTLSLVQHQSRLAEAIRFATRVLHTSKVPASVWREWRQFEKDVTEALRSGQRPDDGRKWEDEA